MRSMMISPQTAQPAVPYPPALTESDRVCFRQNRITLLTLCTSEGQTTARDLILMSPLNILVWLSKFVVPRTYMSPRKAVESSWYKCGGRQGWEAERLALVCMKVNEQRTEGMLCKVWRGRYEERRMTLSFYKGAEEQRSREWLFTFAALICKF